MISGEEENKASESACVWLSYSLTVFATWGGGRKHYRRELKSQKDKEKEKETLSKPGSQMNHKLRKAVANVTAESCCSPDVSNVPLSTKRGFCPADSSGPPRRVCCLQKCAEVRTPSCLRTRATAGFQVRSKRTCAAPPAPLDPQPLPFRGGARARGGPFPAARRPLPQGRCWRALGNQLGCAEWCQTLCSLQP